MRQGEWEQRVVKQRSAVLKQCIRNGKDYWCHTIILKHLAYVSGLLSRTEKEKGS